VTALKRFSTFSHPVSLLIWLVLHLVVLLIPVTQVPLSEEFTRPAEKLAVGEMIVAQIALSSLLLPILMPTPAAVLVIAAASWPFLQLAGVLSSTPPYHVIEAGSFVTVWIIALGLIGGGDVSQRWRNWSAAITSTVSIGGAILAYLRLEFGAGEINGLLFGPIVGALDVVHESADRWKGWIFISVFALVALRIRIAMNVQRRRSQQVIHGFGG
jgi:hypothetical protein